jgi:hypothetical protein
MISIIVGLQMKSILPTAATAAAIFAAILSPAQAVVIGTADSSNGIPFGKNTGGYYYQQVYNSASFGSSINIDEITFYNSLSPGGTARLGTFEIFLSYSTTPIDSFDTDPFSFPSGTFFAVFNNSAPAVSNGRLDFNLSTSFAYDPTKGNLLLTVKEFGLADGSTLFLDADQNNGTTNSRFSSYPYEWNQGLVTGFNDPVAAVPLHPSTWPMMILGCAAFGFIAYRRRNQGTGLSAV